MQYFYFFIEVFAPRGLSGIENHLSECRFPLKTYLSGFNDKLILLDDGSEDYFLSMDTSSDDYMTASGEIYQPLEITFVWLNDLSIVLSKAGFSHNIGFDDANSDRTYKISYRFQEKKS